MRGIFVFPIGARPVNFHFSYKRVKKITDIDIIEMACPRIFGEQASIMKERTGNEMEIPIHFGSNRIGNRPVWRDGKRPIREKSDD
jgi:hypothetical protein